jgi:hypothetical protein
MQPVFQVLPEKTLEVKWMGSNDLQFSESLEYAVNRVK